MNINADCISAISGAITALAAAIALVSWKISKKYDVVFEAKVHAKEVLDYINFLRRPLNYLHSSEIEKKLSDAIEKKESGKKLLLIQILEDMQRFKGYLNFLRLTNEKLKAKFRNPNCLTLFYKEAIEIVEEINTSLFIRESYRSTATKINLSEAELAEVTKKLDEIIYKHADTGKNEKLENLYSLLDKVERYDYKWYKPW